MIDRLSGSLLVITALLLTFIGLSLAKNLSPQETVKRSFETIVEIVAGKQSKQPSESATKVGFPKENLGVIAAMSQPRLNELVTREKVIELYGIHRKLGRAPSPLMSRILGVHDHEGVSYRHGLFTSYDGVEIPFYELLPPGFDEKTRYPVVVLYSGHGNMDQVAFDRESYQRGGALDLAREGFVVFTMENRGMGLLSYLGNHLRIDAVARLTGGSWYGEITTDALRMLDFVFEQSYVDPQRVGVGGVSTGGLLSLMAAALDPRIAASYVQGYLGSYATTFGTRGTHDLCNNIAGILNHLDLKDIAILARPMPALYVNGRNDTFDYADAEKAFEAIAESYEAEGAGEYVNLAIPENTAHELSTSLALDFFNQHLRNDVDDLDI